MERACERSSLPFPLACLSPPSPEAVGLELERKREALKSQDCPCAPLPVPLKELLTLPGFCRSCSTAAPGPRGTLPKLPIYFTHAEAQAQVQTDPQRPALCPGLTPLPSLSASTNSDGEPHGMEKLIGARLG